MKAIVLNNLYYCKYPDEIENLEQFVDFCNKHYNSFVKFTRYSEENCSSPYFIENEFEDIYLNIAFIRSINEEKITILPKNEYDARINEVINSKCVTCANYKTSQGCNRDYKGYINLDGECFQFEEKSE